MGKPTGFLEYKRVTSHSESPTERIEHYHEFHTPISKEEMQKQGARCMECGVPFCQSGKPIKGMVIGCPLNNLIPEWNDLIYRDQWEEAVHRLLLTNNFPEFTSRVCPALCEKACTCGLHGDPVSVRENEWAIIETAFNQEMIKPHKPKVRTGKHVAVVGSGPAGLAAAAQLNKRGHQITVFEREDRIGGLLMYGIPNMKIEKSIIDRRVDLMKQEGIHFMTNASIDTRSKADKLIQDYDAVILACGASQPRDILATGRDATGIYFAVDYLKATTKSLLNTHLEDNNFINAEGKHVVVIGGGDTGNDCVGTAIRQGCQSVVQLEMMPKLPDTRAENNPWPLWPLVSKTDYGQEEAIAQFGHDPRIYETTVKEFIKNEEGNLVAVKTVKVHFVNDAETGKRVLKEVEGSEQLLDADIVLIAAGFIGTESHVAESFDVELNERHNIATDTESYQTSREKVFVAGDMRRGQSLVVWAIKEGREVAKAVDKFLIGYTNLM